MARRNDKRDRLIEAADLLFHQHGVSDTTLAKIADLAAVPLGNVYYYFKSKDSIIMAVIERRKKQLNGLFTDWNAQESVKGRLTALIEYVCSLADESAKFGDALGSLCQELGKQGGAIGQASSQLMNDIIHWCEKQFLAMNKTQEESSKLALNLVASLQGISLITLAFKDPQYVAKQAEYLHQWLETA